MRCLRSLRICSEKAGTFGRPSCVQRVRSWSQRPRQSLWARRFTAGDCLVHISGPLTILIGASWRARAGPFSLGSGWAQ
eukprot:7671708-Karenia_brevis.AAC.1